MEPGSDIPAASAHIVLAGHPTLRQAQQVAAQVKAVLAERFALTNVTLELEEREPVGNAMPPGPELGCIPDHVIRRKPSPSD